MKIESLLGRLEGVRKVATGWTARCPAHEDKQSSLALDNGKSGGIVLKCFAGCEAESIMKAVGLELSDLMPEQADRHKAVETVYSVKLEDGSTVDHVRYDLQDGTKKFAWKRNGQMGLGGMKIADLPLYRPTNQPEEGPVVICEGEKSAIAACRLGLRAYGTMSGANGCPSTKVLKSICDGLPVILWADNDEPGTLHMSKVKSIVGHFAQSCVMVQTGGPKDDAADFRGTKEDFLKLTEKTEPRKTRRLSSGVGGAMASMLRFAIGDHSDRVPFGISKIDKACLGGMKKGAMYVIGADTGGGKTTFLQGVAAMNAKLGTVLLVSPEMDIEELAEREVMRQSGFSIFNIAPWVRRDEKVIAERAMKAAADNIIAEDLNIEIIEDIEATMSEITIEAKKIKNLRLVIIDYAQEIADMSSKLSRYLEVGKVGTDAIKLGRACGCPVLIASQVNKEKAPGGRSEYTFRESKNLSQKANTTMIIEVVKSETPNNQGFFDVESTKIFSLKNRGGPQFVADIDYQPAIYRMTDKAPQSAHFESANRTGEVY